MLDPVAMLMVLTAVGALPFLVVAVSSFTKISIVLGLIRHAVGVQQVPSTMVLNCIALIMTLYIMAPVGLAASERLQQPGGADGTERVLSAASAAATPLREFLSKHSQTQHVDFFLQTARTHWPPDHAESLSRDDMLVLAPAFLLTELAEAFRIGFIFYLGFVVIDMVIACILLAMGLSQTNPTNVAIPFKLLLFVAMDGWTRLLYGLVMSY